MQWNVYTIRCIIAKVYIGPKLQSTFCAMISAAAIEAIKFIFTRCRWSSSTASNRSSSSSGGSRTNQAKRQLIRPFNMFKCGCLVSIMFVSILHFTTQHVHSPKHVRACNMWVCRYIRACGAQIWKYYMTSSPASNTRISFISIFLQKH